MNKEELDIIFSDILTPNSRYNRLLYNIFNKYKKKDNLVFEEVISDLYIQMLEYKQVDKEDLIKSIILYLKYNLMPGGKINNKYTTFEAKFSDKERLNKYLSIYSEDELTIQLEIKKMINNHYNITSTIVDLISNNTSIDWIVFKEYYIEGNTKKYIMNKHNITFLIVNRYLEKCLSYIRNEIVNNKLEDKINI